MSRNNIPTSIWLILATAVASHGQQRALPAGAIFCIGEPNTLSEGFGERARWAANPDDYSFRPPAVFTAGKSRTAEWPFIHPSSHDAWAGSKAHTFTIRFHLQQAPSARLYLTIGVVATREPSLLKLTVNQQEIASQRLPSLPGSAYLLKDASYASMSVPLVFPVTRDVVTAGDNVIGITLDDGSWMIYDYVWLGARNEPPKTAMDEPDLREIAAGPMAGIDDVVFAERRLDRDIHWYANFGYDATGRELYRDGGRLCRLNLRTRKRTVLLDDPKGGVRDPQVSYDAGKILFSYRKAGEAQYHLYEIGADGSNLRQLTSGIYDDIEPTYLPNGEIMFVSSRSKRWVPCWRTQVANLYRSDANGENIRPISSNPEHDNTPWPMLDGRILYTRWEYVDRNEMFFHHLWVINPDGTGQMVYFGNQYRGYVMIDAKPIPGSERIVASFSPGHGRTEHAGKLTIVDPRSGPDEWSSAQEITGSISYRDPWAFSEDCYMAARGPSLVLMNRKGQTHELFRLSAEDEAAGYWLHEPRPLRPRRREPIVPDRVRLDQATGQMFLANVYEGRNMAGLKRGDIKKLLVLEPLPWPYKEKTFGPTTPGYGATWFLERVLGTVPVEADGSAYFEVPALRSLFFVALDENDLSVKRMQSFVTVQPGEKAACVGCHELRTRIPAAQTMPQALRTPPRKITPIEGVPEVFDYPRDIQPVLDDLCVKCHGYEKTPAGGPRAGRLILSGDRGPVYSHSYVMMRTADLYSDGCNDARSNYPPRAIGTGASRLLKMLDGSHHGVVASARQKNLLRLWIESGAVYSGTYAALKTGLVTDDYTRLDRAGQVMARRCAGCHGQQPGLVLPHGFTDDRSMPFIEYWGQKLRDPHTSRHIVFNLSRPEKSLYLLAPLAEKAGGWGLCRDPRTKERVTVFASAEDPDYRELLGMCHTAKDQLEQIKRFDMSDFFPAAEWVREMKRYGVLSSGVNFDSLDVYAVEKEYWESLWYRPVQESAKAGR